MNRARRHLRLVPPPESDRANVQEKARIRLRALEAEHSNLSQLLVADHEASAALFGAGDIERGVARLEDLVAGRDQPRSCDCASAHASGPEDGGA